MIYAVFYGNALPILQLKSVNSNLFITLQKEEDVVFI